jgi:hypothetical protein
MGFADEAISVFGDWGFWGDPDPDMLAAIGDKSGDGSGFFNLGAWAHLASGVATDILPRRAVNEDTSTLQFANSFLFLADGVSLN